DKILNRLADAHGDDDAGADEISIADKLQAKYGVKVGQLWRLGEHRIFCGSCTEAASWKVLMGTDRGQLVHTDPPYGVDYEDAAGQTIKNDKLKQDALAKLIRQGLGHAVHFTHPDAAFYIWHASPTRRDFEFALDQVGLTERQYITWVKDSFNLGRADYHWQTEPCFYAEKAGQRAKWYGDRAQGTVWRIRALPSDGTAIAIASGILLTDGEQAQLYIQAEKPKAAKARHLRVLPDHPAVLADRATSTAWEISRDARKDYAHPNQKPTGLARIAIQNSSKEGDIVIDQFSGSGSTLIACEMTGRRARAMDLEPKWVAVAIERWSKATNQQPEIIQ
ncbi:MAG: site-specific DNA-methyltransferase, partial [Polyangia bacterium]